MSRPLRIRIRWIDIFALRAPRYVVNGVLVHRVPSKRVGWIAGRDTRAALRRPGPQRRRIHWSMFFIVICTWPLLGLLFLFALPVAMDAADSWFEQLTEPLDPLFGVVFAFLLLTWWLPVICVVGWISVWGMRLQILRALRTVATETCLVCNYDLRGHGPASRCPECGSNRILKGIAKE